MILIDNFFEPDYNGPINRATGDFARTARKETE